jgi:exopolyphosphatase/guanosine-5'-triphosphate,3'-diphosphate pyrophosphatase
MTKKRIAAIDLGTNTFHLIIAEADGCELEVLHKENHPIKLGEDLLKENKIIPAAFDRAMNCLANFRKTLDTYQVDELKTNATSAVRSASNGQEFVREAREKCKIEIETIPGDTEAHLIYEGVKLSGAIVSKSLLIDIGGGSTEFIFCDEQQVYWKRSFEIGASKLMQAYFKSDPLSAEDRRQIQQKLEETLQPLISFGQTFEFDTLIGSAGAFESFAAMSEIDINTCSRAELDLASYQALSQKLITATHAQRSQIPNLIPLRVDMIVMACLITDFVIEQFPIKKLRLSTYDLKMGLLASMLSDK